MIITTSRTVSVLLGPFDTASISDAGVQCPRDVYDIPDETPPERQESPRLALIDYDRYLCCNLGGAGRMKLWTGAVVLATLRATEERELGARSEAAGP